MGINFISFHGDDEQETEEIDVEDQPTQPLQKQQREGFLDLVLLDQTIREAQEAYRQERERHCVICQMVRERRSGVYEPRISEPDVCEAHLSRIMALTYDDPSLRSTLHAIIEHAKKHNTWPPPSGPGHPKCS